MSQANNDAELERLVEAQARGERTSAPGVNVEGDAPAGAELDSRRSKSALGFGALTGADAIVDPAGAEVQHGLTQLDANAPATHGMFGDEVTPETQIQIGATSGTFAMQQPGMPAVPHVAPFNPTGGVAPIVYPDVVDDPAYIEAHSRSAAFANAIPGGDVAFEISETGVDPGYVDTQAAVPNPTIVNRDVPTQYADVVDHPDHIEAHARPADLGQGVAQGPPNQA